MGQTELNELSCQKARHNFVFLRIYGFDSRKDQDVCLFPETCRPNVGSSQPVIEWVPGALYRAEKRSERESNHSTTSNAEIKPASHEKGQRVALLLNFILTKNSTYFGKIFCPPSGVLLLYAQQYVFCHISYVGCQLARSS
jgi:hypothetical protein